MFKDPIADAWVYASNQLVPGVRSGAFWLETRRKVIDLTQNVFACPDSQAMLALKRSSLSAALNPEYSLLSSCRPRLTHWAGCSVEKYYRKIL